jgi:hypothetical protein
LELQAAVAVYADLDVDVDVALDVTVLCWLTEKAKACVGVA